MGRKHTHTHTQSVVYCDAVVQRKRPPGQHFQQKYGVSTLQMRINQKKKVRVEIGWGHGTQTLHDGI